MVHAYLMYGFPTQTAQETIDSLEVVRQLLELGVVQSGFWHRFAMTAHSPIGLDSRKYHAFLEKVETGHFANNDVAFADPKGANHEKFSEGLRKSLFNYMHGICFEFPLNEWFDFKVPKTIISPTLIEKAISDKSEAIFNSSKRLLWLGNTPKISYFSKNKKGKPIEMALLNFNNKKNELNIQTEKASAEFLLEILEKISVYQQSAITISQFEELYTKSGLTDFQLFWYSKAMDSLRQNGLLIL